MATLPKGRSSQAGLPIKQVKPAAYNTLHGELQHQLTGSPGFRTNSNREVGEPSMGNYGNKFGGNCSVRLSNLQLPDQRFPKVVKPDYLV